MTHVSALTDVVLAASGHRDQWSTWNPLIAWSRADVSIFRSSSKKVGSFSLQHMKASTCAWNLATYIHQSLERAMISSTRSTWNPWMIFPRISSASGTYLITCWCFCMRVIRLLTRSRQMKTHNWLNSYYALGRAHKYAVSLKVELQKYGTYWIKLFTFKHC